MENFWLELYTLPRDLRWFKYLFCRVNMVGESANDHETLLLILTSYILTRCPEEYIIKFSCLKCVRGVCVRA